MGLCIESAVPMRGAVKFTLLLVALALLAAGLAACGSDDSSDTTAAPTATTTAPANDGSAASEASSGSSSDGDGSASFRTEGGDNSIQDFGEEADSSELRKAEAVVVAYFDGRAANDWTKQCGYLAKSTLKPLEQLAANSPQLGGKGCPTLIEQLNTGVPASSLASPITAGLASLRTENDRGFALFHGPEDVDYFIPMVKEGDDWKVAALAASEFP